MSARNAAPASDLTLRAVPAIKEIDAAAWNACANPTVSAVQAVQPNSEECSMSGESASEIPSNPFISYEFLSSLEDSSSAVARTGWAPHFLLLHGALRKLHPL